MQNLHIVMVDAQEADRRLISEALHTVANCRFAGFCTASEAAEHLSTAGEADLVVISLDTDGAIDLIPILHSNPAWQSIPVALLGSELTRGADVPNSASYPSKPFDFDEHLSLAVELVALAQTYVYTQAVA
jgi:hypothetical protein